MNRRPLVPLLAALALLAACARSAEAPRTLRFTAIPDDDRTELQARFEPLARHLSEHLGVPVEYVPVTSYEASVEAFKNGDVHLAWFGGVTGAQARAAVEGARAIAQGAVDPHYKSYFIAHAGLGIEPGKDFPAALAGTRFAFGSPSSTSGRVMPWYFVEQATGRAPEEFFGSIEFSGSHDRTALLVSEGAVDAGAINYKTYERMVAEGDLDPSVCVRIWTTPTYPDYNWTVHPVAQELLGPAAAERLREVLVGIEDPVLLAACDRREGFVPADDEDFRAVERVSRELGFLR